MTKFTLPKLPYEYNALEPYISEKTLKIHHGKHHQTYCDKFNLALESEGIKSKDFKEIFANVKNKSAIRNNGGGFWNHTFYWESMGNNSSELGENLMEAIKRDFGSFEEFKEKFSTFAASVFGSGWTWLGVNKEGKLVIYNTPNQDNFMMDVCQNKEEPILVIDIWEHAYYLDYQNKRPDYIKEFFNVINWEKVQERFDEIIKNL